MTLDHRFPPPLVVLVTAAAMWLVSYLPPAIASDSLLRSALAVLLAAIGLAVTGLGVLRFRAAGTTIDPTRPERAATMVVSGIYGYTRNPMYLGFTLILLAWAAWLGSPWGFVGPVLFAWYIDRFQIAPEERALRNKFGDQFNAYARRVRRWL